MDEVIKNNFLKFIVMLLLTISCNSLGDTPYSPPMSIKESKKRKTFYASYKTYSLNHLLSIGECWCDTLNNHNGLYYHMYFTIIEDESQLKCIDFRKWSIRDSKLSMSGFEFVPIDSQTIHRNCIFNFALTQEQKPPDTFKLNVVKFDEGNVIPSGVIDTLYLIKNDL